ncbi:hypothetical protein L1887_37971 [Cichorium endivia]|nr:hypothetical protein L1887_37971 [Cichorium endivia]
MGGVGSLLGDEGSDEDELEVEEEEAKSANMVFHLFCFSDFTGSSWVLMEKLSVYTSERQFSGISDSKASFVPDTESLYSDDDLQNKDHIDDDQSLEPELDFEKDQEQEELIELVS